MSRPSSSFSARFLNKNQTDNTATEIASIIPKTTKENYELDPAFILNELSNRVPTQQKQTAGITMPEQAKIPQNFWPTRNYQDSHNSKNQDIQQNSNIEERKFTFVRMGCADTNVINRTMKTPPLPSRTKRINENDKKKCPHYNEKCISQLRSNSTINNSKHEDQFHRPIKTFKKSTKEETKKTKYQKKFDKYYSWKYFGDTDNICGCYTAKVPSSFPEKRLPHKRISNLPNGTNKLDKIMKYPQKAQTSKRSSNLDLYERSITPMTDKTLPLPEFVLTSEENHDFDDYIDSETESYIQFKGKMIPLKSSTLYKLNS